ncbi:ParA family protein [Oligoflexaceae bacterium]|nr:ParA family protein [Oligoflexaceae bacterium]
MKRMIFNNKGGVGKTSIACNLAACLAKLNQRVLVIDLDSQANSTSYLSGKQNFSQTMTDFFESTLTFQMGKVTLSEVIIKTNHQKIWLAPADRGLGEIQAKLESRFKIQKLRKAVDQVIEEYKFDQVIIDTPPAINFYTTSAIIASEKVLIPFDCDAFSLDGLNNVVQLIEEVREDHDLEVDLEGIVVNQFHAGAKLPSHLVDALKKNQLPLIKPFITSSVVMRESRQARSPLIEFKPKHKITQAFMDIAKSLD